jgi:hypothetical protein
MHQRTYDVAHHMVEKCVGTQHDVDPLSSRLDAQLVQRAHRRLRLALGGAERGKIMLAEQVARRVAHRGHVERRVRPACVARRKRGPHTTADEHVAIGARTRSVARVEIFRYAARPQHRDRFWKESIDPAHPRAIGPLGGRVEMDHLPARVHSAVGPAGAGHRYGLARNLRKRGLERVLHGVAGGLRLPALERAAVVFESECNAHRKQSRGRSRAAAFSGAAGPRLPEGGEHLLRLVLLRSIALGDDFVEQFARSVLVAHALIGFRQVELGGDFLPARIGTGCSGRGIRLPEVETDRRDVHGWWRRGRSRLLRAQVQIKIEIQGA